MAETEKAKIITTAETEKAEITTTAEIVEVEPEAAVEAAVEEIADLLFQVMLVITPVLISMNRKYPNLLPIANVWISMNKKYPRRNWTIYRKQERIAHPESYMGH